MLFNNYKGKTVLVTGHTGFKGSWLVMWLQQLGARVVGVALAPDTNPSHYELLSPNIESHFVDIRDYEKIAAIVKHVNPEIIFHLAAQPLVRTSYADPIYTLETNVIGTANLLNICRELKSLRAVVIVTSDKCYENKEWHFSYREIDPMGGHDPYSASKGCAELVTGSFRDSYFNLNKFGKDHQVLIASARAGNVIGGGDWALDRLIPDIARAVASNKEVQIRNPNATRPWQHVLECLSGYLCLGEKLLQGLPQFAEAWNFAPTVTGEVKVLDVVRAMQGVWQKLQYELKTDSNQLHEANLLKLDSSKAFALLQWKNVWDIQKTIGVTTNWYRSFYDDHKILTSEQIAIYEKDASSIYE
jgi:CDP-glucose 4,6-dehydratase